MKKILSALLAFLIIALCACGESTKPAKQRESVPKLSVNDNVLKVAEKSIEILDDYLDLETTKEETNELISALEDRMETMEGVSYHDYEYDDPNYVVLYEISQIYFNLNYGTDTELTASRDIIAFHSGIKLLKKSTHSITPYEPYDFTEAEEKAILEKVGVVGLPATYADAYSGDRISVSFDAMYGISVSDCCQYACEILEKASALDEGYHINVYLEEYGISVARITISQDPHPIYLEGAPEDADFYAYVYRIGDYDNAIEVYKKTELEAAVLKVWNAG